jgi:hypothetical protein
MPFPKWSPYVYSTFIFAHDQKRLSAVLHSTEYLFLDNMAVKLVLEHRGLANWQIG